MRPTRFAVRKPSSVSDQDREDQPDAGHGERQIVVGIVDAGDERLHPAVDPMDEGPGEVDRDADRSGDDDAGQEIVPEPHAQRATAADGRRRRLYAQARPDPCHGLPAPPRRPAGAERRATSAPPAHIVDQKPGRLQGRTDRGIYSTVTDFARLRGWSTSVPARPPCDRRAAGSGANRRSARASGATSGSTIVSIVLSDASSAPRRSVIRMIFRRAPRPPACWRRSSRRAVMRRDDDDRHLLVDQRDRPVLQLAGGIALGVDVGDFLELQRAFQGQRIDGAAAEIEDVGGLARAPSRASRSRGSSFSTCAA